MTDTRFVIRANERIARDVFRLRLEGDASALKTPGQFVNVALPGKYLRRPFSVCDWSDREVTLLYKVVGAGTGLLSRLSAGTELDVLVGLGNGFDAAAGGETPVLVGGGLGAAPLPALAKSLLRRGARPVVCLGFATRTDVLLAEELEALGLEVRVATVDGSAGRRGMVTDLLPASSYVFACGPEPMLRAVYDCCADGQFSFENRMGCGFGACMGCTCETNFGPKRVCRDGPVFRKEEILWQKRL